MGATSPPVADIDALFARAERQIALLARARPVNVRAECTAWALALRRGQRHRLAWRYAPAPDLGRLRGELERAARAFLDQGPLGRLYAQRAAELELEARLAERVGSDDFASLARQRHPVRRGPEHERARQLAAEWAAIDVPSRSERSATSDDWRDPESLISLLSSEISRLCLPIRVEVRHDLSSRAACGDGLIVICAGLPLAPFEARRIIAHELHGHAVPRLMGRRHPLGLLRVGCAGANDDEEGRALHIEEHVGLLHAARRRELGWRHLTALDVAGAADPHDCVTRLRQFGCDLDEAVAIYARAARGGGLCRELEYIPAWLRFGRALHDDAPLAAWLARGRVSLDAARVLCDEGVPVGDGQAPILDLSVASDRATREGT